MAGGVNSTLSSEFIALIKAVARKNKVHKHYFRYCVGMI